VCTQSHGPRKHHAEPEAQTSLDNKTQEFGAEDINRNPQFWQSGLNQSCFGREWLFSIEELRLAEPLTVQRKAPAQESAGKRQLFVSREALAAGF
jgi:hypothetical protein